MVTLDGAPWFVAKDVCDVLGLQPDGTRYTRHLNKLEAHERRFAERGSDTPSTAPAFKGRGCYVVVRRR